MHQQLGTAARTITTLSVAIWVHVSGREFMDSFSICCQEIQRRGMEVCARLYAWLRCNQDCRERGLSTTGSDAMKPHKTFGIHKGHVRMITGSCLRGPTLIGRSTPHLLIKNDSPVTTHPASRKCNQDGFSDSFNCGILSWLERGSGFTPPNHKPSFLNLDLSVSPALSRPRNGDNWETFFCSRTSQV